MRIMCSTLTNGTRLKGPGTETLILIPWIPILGDHVDVARIGGLYHCIIGPACVSTRGRKKEFRSAEPTWCQNKIFRHDSVFDVHSLHHPFAKRVSSPMRSEGEICRCYPPSIAPTSASATSRPATFAS